MPLVVMDLAGVIARADVALAAETAASRPAALSQAAVAMVAMVMAASRRVVASRPAAVNHLAAANRPAGAGLAVDVMDMVTNHRADVSHLAAVAVEAAEVDVMAVAVVASAVSDC